MKKGFLLSVLFLLIITALIGCGSSGSNTGGGSNVYGGIDPKGDYIAVTIDTVARTVTEHNYTLGENNGPFTYTRVTDSSVNGGFQNIYQTQNVAPDQYARFVVINGVTLIYQIFDDNGTSGNYSDDAPIGNPVYAFARTQVNMSGFKGSAFNWMKFKMGSNGDFSAGFAAFDTVSSGLMYGAGYDNRDEIDNNNNPPYGVHTVNEGNVLGTSLFAYDSSTYANTYSSGGNTLSLIGTPSNDFILDFGLNQGGGIAIRQASSSAYNTAYDGTYLMILYENDYQNSLAQTTKILKVKISNGQFDVFQMGDPTSGAGFISGSLETIADTTKGPHDNPVAQQFETISGCANATSTVVKNAYKCNGMFLYQSDIGLQNFVGVFMFDPSGQYLCFDSFEHPQNTPGNYTYRFGFGVKDPNYIDP